MVVGEKDADYAMFFPVYIRGWQCRQFEATKRYPAFFAAGEGRKSPIEFSHSVPQS